MATTTPRLGLSRPQRGDLNWDADIQAWLDRLDTYGAFSDKTLAYTAAQTFTDVSAATLIATDGTFTNAVQTEHLTVNGLSIYGVGTLTLYSGANDNVVLADKTVFQVQGPGSAFSITGLSGGVFGRRIIIYSATAYQMTLVNASTGSSATNRIYTTNGTDVLVAAEGCVELLYMSRAAGPAWVVTGFQL